ncbi:uncharacterized protein LOC143291501 [Babylonia areolata]|uniref:uncharacterized protein LOC143291501 n=1 Tax=Babylonia areolata TaxID=304850 RepID=UPI003FCF130C
MATEKGFVAPPVSSLRKIMKPVISTDVMGNRNVEVRAVGARAEPALYFTQIMNPEFSDAVRAAAVEEEKIKVIQEKKAARLKQFQEDVRRRVRQINKTKRKQQLENDYQSMENHLNQVRSSLRASDCLTERKDCIVSHHVPAVSVPPPALSSGANRLMGDGFHEQDRRKKAFEQHNEQVHTYTSEARKKLSNRRVESDILETDHLPGGKWFTFETSGKPMKMRGEPLDKEDEEENSYTSNDDDNDTKEALYDEEGKSPLSPERLEAGRAEDHIKYFTLPPQSCSSDGFQEAEKGGSESEEEKDETRESEERDDEDERAKVQRVKFNLRTVEARRSESAVKRTTRKKGSRTTGCRPQSAPDLRAGATEYAERRRLEQQKLNYRRLYSDLERQAVRDNQRRKNQRSQIQKIKKEKEELRRQEEERARRLVEPRDPVTGETSVECDLRQQMERSHLQEVLQEREDQRQKQREMIRYLDALRSNLREKLNKQGLELPALCCCGETLFDTHPDTCANNCFYYRNHRAYARALQSLLTSSEIP